MNASPPKKAEQEKSKRRKKDFTDKDELSNATRVSAELLFLHSFTAVVWPGQKVKRPQAGSLLMIIKRGIKKIPNSFTSDLSLTSQNNSEIKRFFSHLSSAPQVSSPLLSVTSVMCRVKGVCVPGTARWFPAQTQRKTQQTVSNKMNVDHRDLCFYLSIF